MDGESATDNLSTTPAPVPELAAALPRRSAHQGPRGEGRRLGAGTRLGVQGRTARGALGITAQENKTDAEDEWAPKIGEVRDPRGVAGLSILRFQSSYSGTRVLDKRHALGELYWNSCSRPGRLGSAGAGWHSAEEGGRRGRRLGAEEQRGPRPLRGLSTFCSCVFQSFSDGTRVPECARRKCVMRSPEAVGRAARKRGGGLDLRRG
jgi:hypothetical protein